jgi:integrase
VLKIGNLSALKVYDIKPLTLQRLYNDMDKMGLKKTVIPRVNRLLCAFFNYALLQGYIVKNPTYKLTIPTKKEYESSARCVAPFTNEEINLIINNAKGLYKFLFKLAFATGLRRGELLGLKVKDLDLINNEIHVVHALKDVKSFEDSNKYVYKRVLEQPKTKSSIRIVPIPSAIISDLKKYLNEQKEKCMSLGQPYNDECFLFTNKFGRTINSSILQKAWIYTLEHAGVERRVFHNTRHTYATKLFEQGVPLKTVQVLLGHANIAITSAIYTHVMPREKEMAVDRLNFIFESGTKN